MLSEKCLQRDSNPQSEEVDFKSTAYTNFAMEALRRKPALAIMPRQRAASNLLP